MGSEVCTVGEGRRAMLTFVRFFANMGVDMHPDLAATSKTFAATRTVQRTDNTSSRAEDINPRHDFLNAEAI